MAALTSLRGLLRRAVPLAVSLALGCTGVIGGDLEGLPGGDFVGTDTDATDAGDGGVQCQPGLDACGLDCIDLNSSSEHCGECRNACAPGELCALGTCGTDCVAPYEECSGQCVNLQIDAAHCGGCGRTCEAGVPCYGGGCGCPAGTLICNGQCVDPNSNRAHCGGCAAACDANELCVGGDCVPESDGCPFDSCEGACVDTQTSPAHCGGCGIQCSTGQTCQGGECECTAPGTSRCGDLCVNLSNDVAHCGECSRACTGGYPCTDGECACPEGQELCSGACEDLDSSTDHCGACGESCPAGETCIAGRCSGSAGDDCTNTPATGITLREIAVLQAGKISVMSNGAAVQQRPADIVAGKAAVFRAYVDLGGGFGSRVLSARLSLVEGDVVEQLFHKRTVSNASTESNWSSTFNIQVPAGKLTSSTRFVVELVECDGTPSGSGGAPRYPAAGTAELGARNLGRLKIRYIPLNAPNGSNPDTSPGRLAVYTSYVEAMFPVAGVDTSLGAPLSVNTISANGDGWNQALSTLRNRHEADNAPNDLYYYGLFQPSSSSFCNGGCVAGIGYLPEANNGSRHHRVSLGLSLGNRGSAETMAHEVGHNHGRPHSPCGGPDDPDPGFPYAGGLIGWMGFETTSTLHEPDRTDIMGYCRNKWISDYVYQHFANRVAAINGTGMLSMGLPVALWRSVLVGPSGPEWGAPSARPTEAAGAPEPAQVLDARGNQVAAITVYRTLIDHLGAAELMVPEPEPGWHAIVIQGEVPLAFDAVNSSLP